MGARLGRFQERSRAESAPTPTPGTTPRSWTACIAKLVDSLREMQQCCNGMCDKGKQLGDALKGLKGRIPAPNMPPGAAGDDEDDDRPTARA